MKCINDSSKPSDMKEKLWSFIRDPKNWVIIALVVIIGLIGLFGGKAVSRYNSRIERLSYEKFILSKQISNRDLLIKVEQAKIRVHKATIDSCMTEFRKKDKKIGQLEKNLTDALDQLEGISSDSCYIFLTRMAYNYPGLLSYIFNENQIKAIHGDYLRARSAEQVIPELKLQIGNCLVQFKERDDLVKNQETIITLQDKNLQDCKQINANNDIIIKDLEKTVSKEKWRKNLWRIIASAEPGIAVALIVALGIL